MIPQLIPALSGGPDAYLDFDFRFSQERYWLNRQRYGEFGLVPGAISTGGAGFGQALRNGVWSGNLPDGTPLIGDGGLGVWEAGTNVQARSNPIGAVVGSPGSAPTGWFIQLGLSNGVTRSIAGAGTDTATGLPYVDVAFSGTFTNAENVTITPGTNVFVTSASPGQSWSAAVFWALISGALPAPAVAGVNGTRVRFGNPGLLAQLASSDIPNTNFAVRQLTQNAIAPALTTTVGSDWLWSFAAGRAVNFVVRLGHMQLEQGAFASPPIFTEATAATRTAVAQSVGGLNLPPVGAIYAEWVQPIIQTTTRTYAWATNDGDSNRFCLRASVGSGNSTIQYVVGDGAVVTSIDVVAPAAGTLIRSIACYDTLTARAAFALNGADATMGRRLVPAAVVNAAIGSGMNPGPGSTQGQLNSTLRRLVALPRFPEAAERIAITTGGL